MNGETYGNPGYSSADLYPGNNTIRFTRNGSVLYSNLTAANNSVYFLNFAPLNVSLNFIASGLPMGTHWNLSINGTLYSFKNYEGSVDLRSGAYYVQIYPTATDFSIFYPIVTDVSVNLSYHPVSVLIVFKEEERVSSYNLTSKMNGIGWSTQMAYNLGYVIYGGGGDMELMNVSSMSVTEIGNPFPDGQVYSVSPYKEGFLTGGSMSNNRPGISYYNITTGEFTNLSYHFPNDWNGSFSRISAIFPTGNNSFSFIGGGAGSPFFGIFRNGTFDNLDSYLPSYFSDSSLYYGSYIPSCGCAVISDGVYTGVFYYGNDTFDSISYLLPESTSVGSFSTFTPSQSFIVSDGNLSLLIGESSGHAFVGEYSPSSGLKDISSYFPQNEFFDSVTWSGRNFLLSGVMVNGSSPLVCLYDPSSGSLSVANTTEYGDVYLVDSAILVNSTLFFTTFNSKPIPNTIYVTDYSYYGTTKLTPTGTIKLNVNVSSEIEIDNQTYYGESQTIPEFAGNYTINISSTGFLNYTTVIDLRPFETLYLNVTLETKLYGITFTESGLPSETSWAITLNGNVESSSTNTITFTEPNGTYDFSIGNTTGYTVLPQSGVVAVNGTSVSESVIFTQTVQKGYFVGSVSPSNASIQIFINSSWVAYKENNGSFNISLNPGTYRVSVVAAGYATYSTNITITSLNVTHLPIQRLSRSSPPPSLPAEFILVGAVVIIAVTAAIIMITVGKRKR